MIFKNFLAQNAERSWPFVQDVQWDSTVDSAGHNWPTRWIVDFGAVLGPLGSFDWTKNLVLTDFMTDSILGSIGMVIRTPDGTMISQIAATASQRTQTVLWTHIDGPSFGHGFIVLRGGIPPTSALLVSSYTPAPTVYNATFDTVLGTWSMPDPVSPAPTVDLSVAPFASAPKFEWSTMTNRTGQGILGIRVFNTQSPTKDTSPYVPQVVEVTTTVRPTGEVVSYQLTGDVLLAAGQCAVVVQDSARGTIDIQATTVDTIAGKGRCLGSDTAAPAGYDQYSEVLCCQVLNGINGTRPDAQGSIPLAGVSGATVSATNVPVQNSSGTVATPVLLVEFPRVANAIVASNICS